MLGFGEKIVMVSVIIPAYNTSAYLEDAIHSVMSLKGVETELIVVDDGSTDDTPERLKKMQSIYPAMRIFSRKIRVHRLRATRESGRRRENICCFWTAMTGFMKTDWHIWCKS